MTTDQDKSDFSKSPEGQRTTIAIDKATVAINKDVLKDALKEWMDEKFATFGKWSSGTIAAAFLVAIIYFIVTLNGFHR